MDRDALARAARRAQAVEALEFEQARETELRRQVAEVLLEQEGDRLDAAALEEEDPFADNVFVELDFDDEPEDEEPEDETARLEREIEESLRIQSALERFIAALDAQAATEAR